MSEAAKPKPNQAIDTDSKVAHDAADCGLTDAKLAAYILDALVSFRQMTDQRGLNFLTYLLDMATQEASDLCDQPLRSKKRI